MDRAGLRLAASRSSGAAVVKPAPESPNPQRGPREAGAFRAPESPPGAAAPRAPGGRVGLACALVATLVACSGRAVRKCEDLLEAGDHEAAMVSCEQTFETTGDPRAGAAAAAAHAALGHGDEVLAWLDRLRDSPREAAVRLLAGRVHERRGDSDLAEKAYLRALALSGAAGDHEQASRSCYRLFYLSWASSDYRGALRFAQQAFEEASKAGDRELQARAIQGVYAVLYDVGDLEGAERALDAARELVVVEDPEERARFLTNRGAVRLDQGRLALARDAFEEALGLAAGSDNRRLLRSAHLNLAEIALRRGDPEGAAVHVRAAWEHAEPGGAQTALLYYRARVAHARGRHGEALAALDTALGGEPIPGWAWHLEYRRGLAREAVGDDRAAAAAFERAIRILEGIRSSLAIDDLKSWLLDEQREPYEALFRLQARSERPVAALATLERATARTFLDAFVKTASGPRPAAPEPSDTRAAAERLEALWGLLPAMGTSPVVAPRPAAEILDALGQRHALLYLDVGEEQWALTVTGRRVRAAPLQVSPEGLERLVDRFLERPDDPELGSRLGGLLLPPAGELPAPGSPLLVVADGALGRLPFAALRHEERYLVEDHPIAYVPSLSALAAIESRAPGGSGPPVVLADPRGDLPGAAREAVEVAALLDAAVGTGEAASSPAFREAATAAVLHLATHTGLGPRGPWLLLADGEVDASTVLQARIAPRFVALASCASAARRGRGLWGSLGATFLAAGSRAVLASLWSVEDQTTRAFIGRFYREGGALEPATALARTQRSLIVAGEPPSVWAPFVLFGTDRSLAEDHQKGVDHVTDTEDGGRRPGGRSPGVLRGPGDGAAPRDAARRGLRSGD